jgi:spore germination cell wall hydrolase CwlJ-like protein
VNQQDYADRTFMALCVWREARGASAAAQGRVAHCIMNRVKRPAWWGRDIMSVIFKKWQFSSLTDPNDRQLTTWPKSDDKSWIQCLKVACGVIDGVLPNPVPGADSYFDTSIQAPYWATPETFVRQIDNIRFYNLDKDVEHG